LQHGAACDILNPVRIGNVVWALFAFAVACGGGGGDDVEVEVEVEVEDEPAYCERFCQRLAECSPAESTSSCRPSCDDWEKAGVLNDQFLDQVGPCVAAASCDTLLADEAIGSCLEEGAAGVEPSAALIESCNELAQREFSCGYPADTGLCVDALKIYRPEAIEGFLSCSESDCDGLFTCYEVMRP
jgi:hypothetical protein